MINPPLNYTGNKFKLLPQILPNFDYTKKYFVDVFAGGGAAFSNVCEKYEKIWINDIIEDLIGIHKSLIFEGYDFANIVKQYCSPKDDQQAYIRLRADYNREKHPAKLMALGLCSQNNFFRFNSKGEFNQTWGKRSFNDSTEKKFDAYIPYISQFKNKFHFSSLDFEDIKVKDIKNTTYYFDPPYNSKINGAANYNLVWDDEDDLRLFAYIIDIHSKDGSFCLSNVYSENEELNAPIVNKLLDNRFKMVKLDGDYRKVARNKDKIQMTEILIKNYA